MPLFLINIVCISDLRSTCWPILFIFFWLLEPLATNLLLPNWEGSFKCLSWLLPVIIDCPIEGFYGENLHALLLLELLLGVECFEIELPMRATLLPCALLLSFWMLNGMPPEFLIKSFRPFIILLFSIPTAVGIMPVFLLSPKIRFLWDWDSFRTYFISHYFSLLIILGRTYSLSYFSMWMVVTLIPVSYLIIILQREIRKDFEVIASVCRNHVM